MTAKKERPRAKKAARLEASPAMAEALRQLVAAMRTYDESRRLFLDDEKTESECQLYERLEVLRKLLVKAEHRGEHPAFIEAVNQIEPFAFDSEVFSKNIPGSTERFVAKSLPKLKSVVARLATNEPPKQETKDNVRKYRTIFEWLEIHSRFLLTKNNDPDLTPAKFARSEKMDESTMRKGLEKAEKHLAKQKRKI